MLSSEYSSYFPLPTPLSIEQAQELIDDSERYFALRCIAAGCLLWHEIPIDQSCIDFLVVNPKILAEGELPTYESGTLVEVTFLSVFDKDKKMKVVSKNGVKKKVLNETGKRKNNQIQAMRNSGHRWTILYKENLVKMLESNTLKNQDVH